MKIFELNKINKLTFSVEDISSALSITKESAKVSATRYVKSGLLLRLKNNLYITTDKFERLNEEELFKLVNVIQVPSYISFTTALSYYNISSQQLQNTVESAALKRTKNIVVNSTHFSYILLKKNFYNNFIVKNDFFIATPEKAMADVIYLSSINRYQCDFEAVDFKKIDKKIISNLLEATNLKTINFWNSLCKRYKI
jgi:predicted transcriptional regulator of viral defense system